MRIAVCDDNKTELEKIKSCFCRLHEHCTECRYFVSAKDLLSTEMPTQDMYILDIEMPDMNGLELAKKIREKDSRALFVFLTQDFCRGEMFVEEKGKLFTYRAVTGRQDYK